jgi:hypothetical protein
LTAFRSLTSIPAFLSAISAAGVTAAAHNHYPIFHRDVMAEVDFPEEIQTP